MFYRIFIIKFYELRVILKFETLMPHMKELSIVQVVRMCVVYSFRV